MRSNFKDLTGQKFGRLTVLELNKERCSDGQLLWLCKCECGKTKFIRGRSLKRGLTQSCGCFRNEQATIANSKHGDTNSRFYKIYLHIQQRCFNFNNYNYCERGITICDRWLEPDGKGYLNFKEDMYESYLKHVEEFGEKQTSIDRINNNLGYSKENCRWATQSEQMGNTRNSKLFEATYTKPGKLYGYKEVSKNQSEFARKYVLIQSGISQCLRGIIKQYKYWVFKYI